MAFSLDGAAIYLSLAMMFLAQGVGVDLGLVVGSAGGRKLAHLTPHRPPPQHPPVPDQPRANIWSLRSLGREALLRVVVELADQPETTASADGKRS